MTRHCDVQAAAKEALALLPAFIDGDATEASIAAFARELLADRGYTSTWYHDCMALVLLGGRSCVSVSGKDYQPSRERVGDFNLVTVDLSPCAGKLWGDCARSFCVESGVVVAEPRSAELQSGLRMQSELHAQLLAHCSAGTTLHEIAEMAGVLLEQRGYENLDFLGNFGHSITTSLQMRQWVERGSRVKVADVGLFTFEPHIRQQGGRWGFKHENIYVLGPDGRVREL